MEERQHTVVQTSYTMEYKTPDGKALIGNFVARWGEVWWDNCPEPVISPKAWHVWFNDLAYLVSIIILKLLERWENILYLRESYLCP
jgi:hypothetical protein